MAEPAPSDAAPSGAQPGEPPRDPPGGALAAVPARVIRPVRRLARRWVRAATETRTLVLFAVAVRLLAAWSGPAVVNDSVSLLRSAERLTAEGAGVLLAMPHHPLPPLVYALAGAAGRGVGLDIETTATLLGALAAGLAVWPLHSLARRACGRNAAVAAGILYVALPKAVAVGAVPLAEALFLPLFLGALALAAGARAAGPRMTRRLLGAGLLAALAYLCRPEGLLAVPGVLAAATLDGRPGRLRRAALVMAGFLPLALGYAGALSVDRGTLAVSPKKDVARFVGARAPRVGEPTRPPPVEGVAPPLPESPGDVAAGVAGALDSALTLPIALLALVGLARPGRWRRSRARRPRLLVAGTAFLLVLALARLQAGWGYAGGRHALAAGVLLLVFAGQGLTTFGELLPRMTSRRRFAIVAALLLAIPLAARAVLRPPGESGVAARRLGEAIAAASSAPRRLRIASSAEPLVAWYAGRALRDRGGADDVPLWGRFVHPLEAGAPLDAVADALGAELRDEADWVVLDVTPARGDAPPAPGRALAEALRARGVLGAPALAAGSALAAFPVAR